MLGGEEFGRAGEFGPEGLGFPLEAVGIVCPALHDRSLATLFEFHNLELETDGVVFQTGIDHRYARTPAGERGNVSLRSRSSGYGG